MHKKLPSKPSRLIEIALEDLKKTERSPELFVDMRRWVSKKGNRCSVCFAGSVMAHRTAKDEIDRYSHRYEERDGGYGDAMVDDIITTRNGNAYYALDDIRQYRIDHFLDSCYDHSCNKRVDSKLKDLLKPNGLNGCYAYHILKGIKKVPYHKNKTVFKRNMRTIANRLKKLGL